MYLLFIMMNHLISKLSSIREWYSQSSLIRLLMKYFHLVRKVGVEPQFSGLRTVTVLPMCQSNRAKRLQCSVHRGHEN